MKGNRRMGLRDVREGARAMTSAADLRAAAARIERDAPGWAARMRREADQMDEGEAMSGSEVDSEQLAIVLDRIAEHSSDASIREHIRLVATQLRGSGFIIVNLPPSAGEVSRPPQ
jgi:hypothetical protein